jgi:hypothetical protein
MNTPQPLDDIDVVMSIMTQRINLRMRQRQVREINDIAAIGDALERMLNDEPIGFEDECVLNGISAHYCRSREGRCTTCKYVSRYS